MIEAEGSKIEEREPLFRKTCPYFPPVVERDEHTTVVCNLTDSALEVERKQRVERNYEGKGKERKLIFLNSLLAFH